MTLTEALLAMTVMSVVMLAISYAGTAGHQHLRAGGASLEATRLAEHLMEEILSRPYEGSGGSERSSYHIGDYDGFEEEPGALADFTGQLYAAAAQVFRRWVTVEDDQHTLAELGGETVMGLRVVVSVEDERGQVWSVSRFICER